MTRDTAPPCPLRLVRLDQTEMPVFPAIEDADGVGVGVAEDDERLGAAVDALRRIRDGHRLDRVARGADDARRRVRRLRPDGHGRGPLDAGHAAPGLAALALGPLALD